jgi:hypothetical protein
MATTSNISSPGLQEATKNSTTAWQVDLEALFHHAKDRFPDVVWELGGSEDDEDDDEDGKKNVEEVWGHKGKPSKLNRQRWDGLLYCSDRLCQSSS